MEWHFGYNCKNFVPTFGKCRVLIDLYNKRPDLTADKWLKTRDFLVYWEHSAQELIDQVMRGEVETKKVKKPKNPEEDGYWRFRMRCSWAWDDCALAATGGMCMYFEPHDGKKISCIADIRHLDAEHPNMEKVPSDNDVRLVEDQLSELRLKDC